MKHISLLFAQLFERSFDGVLLLRPDGAILRANASACRALHRTEAEVCAAGRAGLVVEDDTLRALLSTRASGVDVQGEASFCLPDGTIFPAEFTSGLLPTDEGDYAYVIFRDVSERHLVEAALKRANRALRLLTACNELVVRATNEQALFTDVCRAMIDLGGYVMCWVGLAEDDERKTVRPVAHAGRDDGYLAMADIVWADVPRGQGPTGTAIRTGRPVLARSIGDDTAMRPWREQALQRGYYTSSALPLMHDGERLGAITMYSQAQSPFDDPELELLRQLSADVALGVSSLRARKSRDQAAQQRDRLVTAIEQAAETVVVTDARGDIVYANPAFEVATGFSRAEVLGRNPRVLKSGVQGRELYAELWRTISAGKTWSGRLVNRRKDGSTYTEEATISPVLDPSGTITSYVAVKRDISQELALEAQLIQSQKMEGIGRLAGGVAHDFNNILSVILGCAGTALELVEDGPLRLELAEILKAGERAALLTRQLLAFSRKQVLQPQRLDLGRVLTDMHKVVRRLLGEDVDLVQVLASGLGEVHADPGQLEQVVMNLVINARDAMPRGGRLVVETANVELDEARAATMPGARAGPHVTLSVTDTGVGMDAETKRRVFEPFFTTKGTGRATGLGLSTVYGIVKQSGGCIEVHSAPGQGATFTVFLPRQAAGVVGRRRDEAPRAPRPAQVVLVVEDDEGVRALAGRILSGAGFTVLTAESGAAALLVAERHGGSLDLVLTDVVMPEMSGRVLVERMSALRHDFKVLYMSGYADDALGPHGVLEPGTHFMAKPLSRSELLRQVRHALES